jgi:hypothetical protein
VSRRHGLPVVGDAACALGTEIELAGVWSRIGKPHSVVACFSFHPRKVVTTGDGGMITAADVGVAERCRLLRQHAMTVTPEARDKDPLAEAAFVEPAFNLRMTDLQAAVGRPQLSRLDAIIAERRRLAAVYDQALADHPLLAAPTVRKDARPNWQSYPTTIRPGGRLSQDDLMRFFHDKGIACRRGLCNAHEESAYKGRGLAVHGLLPVSEEIRRTTLVLPLFHGMTAAEQGVDTLAPDSSQAFRTDAGRVVYGGGGIRPDLFVVPDTFTASERRFMQALGDKIPTFRDVLSTYALELKAGSVLPGPAFTVTGGMVDEVLRRLRARGAPVPDSVTAGARALVAQEVGYEAARYVFGRPTEFRRRMADDRQVQQALALARRGCVKVPALWPACVNVSAIASTT